MTAISEPERLTASMPASAALVAVLQGFRSTVEQSLDEVIADRDPESLHAFRVAVRRSRSTLKLGAEVLKSVAAEQLKHDLKWLGDLSSPTRDLDVYIAGLPDMAAGLQTAQPVDLQPFGEYLRAQRDIAFTSLLSGLRSPRFHTILDNWRALRPHTQPPGPGQPVSAGELAAQRQEDAHRRVTERGRSIGPDSPPESLHDLRKRGKELRYLLEIFRPLHDPATHRAALKDLKALQEVLGSFQDAEVQSLAVRDFASALDSTQSSSAATASAMDELATQLRDRQRDARAEFAAAFAAFDSAASRARFSRLVGAETG